MKPHSILPSDFIISTLAVDGRGKKLHSGLGKAFQGCKVFWTMIVVLVSLKVGWLKFD